MRKHRFLKTLVFSLVVCMAFLPGVASFADGPGSGPLNDDTVVSADIGSTLKSNLEASETFGSIFAGEKSTLTKNTVQGPGTTRQDATPLQTQYIDYNVSGNVHFTTQARVTALFTSGANTIPVERLEIGVGGSDSWTCFDAFDTPYTVVADGDPTATENGVDYGFDLRLDVPDNQPAGSYTATLRFTTTAI